MPRLPFAALQQSSSCLLCGQSQMQCSLWCFPLAGERGDAASILSDGSVLSQVYISFVLPSLAFLWGLLVATLAVRVISDWIQRLVQKK